MQRMWSEWRNLFHPRFALVVFLLFVFQPVSTNIEQGSCFHCNGGHEITRNNDVILQRQRRSICTNPCECANSQVICQGGVNIIRDGCDCCFMCARQQGDLCNYRDKCDEDKGLYCDFNSDDEDIGICRAREAKPCDVDGRTIDDGTQFKPSCRKLCSCQNGNYGCTSLCPQEDHKPQSIHCKNPQLVAIKGRCCKEWVCSPSNSLPDSEFSSPNGRLSDFHNCSAHLRNHQHMSISIKDTSIDHTHDENWSSEAADEDYEAEPCQYEASPWSPCSVSCGMGQSTRVTNNNDQCQPVQEHRLCFVRPCDMNDTNKKGKRCKNTWRQVKPVKFEYNGCTSIKEYRPKYCSTCKRRRCCFPDRAKTNGLEWACGDGEIVVYDFMWIKSCVCKDKCP